MCFFRCNHWNNFFSTFPTIAIVVANDHCHRSFAQVYNRMTSPGWWQNTGPHKKKLFPITTIPLYLVQLSPPPPPPLSSLTLPLPPIPLLSPLTLPQHQHNHQHHTTILHPSTPHPPHHIPPNHTTTPGWLLPVDGGRGCVLWLGLWHGFGLLSSGTQ